MVLKSWQLTACLTRRFTKATYGGQRPNLHLPSLVKASKNPITANFMRSLGSNEVLFQIFRKHQQQTSRANCWELLDFKKNLPIFSVTNSKQRRNSWYVQLLTQLGDESWDGDASWRWVPILNHVPSFWYAQQFLRRVIYVSVDEK